ncbi:MAG TPA: hypothetical protein VFW83_04565, partial [Bryobacteraceae bacterium]|nr:hypothetical protein [Bryobacteraceae bacterium]
MAALGFSDTARAQPQLTVTPQTDQQNPLSFVNVPVNSISRTQNVQLSATGGSPSVIVQPDQASPWIVLSNTVLNLTSTPTPLGVQVNTQGLQQGVTYQGTFTIAMAGSAAPPAVVYVSVLVGGNSALSANQPSLDFSAQQGAQSGTTSNPIVKISVTSGPQLNYTLQAKTQDGGNWLLLSSTTGTTGDDGFTVSVNPSALVPATLPATYNGTITAQSTTTNDSVQIPVTLTITAGPALSASPSTLPAFLWQSGTANPDSQQVTLAATGGAVSFSVRESPAVNWLVVTPLSGTAGTTPATLTLQPVPNAASLQPNSYTTNVIVSSGGSDLITIPVKLIVSANPLLRLSLNSLAYTAQFGATQPPADQQATVTSSDGSSGEAFSFTSDSTWLTASTSSKTAFATSGTGTTPATLAVRVNPAGLQVQDYTGTIMIQPTNGDQYTEFITVKFSVAAAASLTAAPPELFFSYQTGQAVPAAQNVQIQSTGQPVQFTATPIVTSTPSCPANWLSAVASSSTTPATITAIVDVSGMTPGSCGGTIRIDYNSGAGSSTMTVPVTVAVSAADKSELSISMPEGFGVETAQLGAADFTRLIALTSTNPASPVDFNATANSTGGAWLFVAPGIGQTPQNLAVKISPSVLTSPGQYSGQIKLTSTSLPQTEFDIQVSLTIRPNITVTAAPASLSFTEGQNGPLPAAQTLTLTSAGGAATFTSSIQYNNGNNWLQISPSSGNASGPIQVSVLQNSFSPGDYTAQILLALQGASTASIPINVSLHVTPPQTLSASAQSLNFAYQIGGAAPASQK